jgi:hypothetical protein
MIANHPTYFKQLCWHYIAPGAKPLLTINDLRRDNGRKSTEIFSKCGSWANPTSAVEGQFLT